jgi:hypothetical protein
MPREAVVTSTKAVRHYGVSANAVYKEAEDAGQPKIWDRFESIYRVSKMTWYINYVSLFSRTSIHHENLRCCPQDDDLVRDQRVEFSFYRQLPTDYKPSDLIFTDELLECAQIEAVKYPMEGEVTLNLL